MIAHFDGNENIYGKLSDFPGGSPASNDNTGEQWDFPNAWPPLQSIIVLGLQGTGWEPATSLAKELASTWLRSNYAGWTETGEMFEKVSERASSSGAETGFVFVGYKDTIWEKEKGEKETER